MAMFENFSQATSLGCVPARSCTIEQYRGGRIASIDVSGIHSFGYDFAITVEIDAAVQERRIAKRLARQACRGGQSVMQEASA